jgi:Mor family transcriptional regulator
MYSVLRLDTHTRNQRIRQRYEAGETLSDLARAFEISPQRVHQIVNPKLDYVD